MTKLEARKIAIELDKTAIESQTQAAPVSLTSIGATNVAKLIETPAARLEKME